MFGTVFETRSRLKPLAVESGQPTRSAHPEAPVVVEFDSYETALAARGSEAYQKAVQALGSGAIRDFRIVEGGEDPS